VPEEPDEPLGPTWPISITLEMGWDIWTVLSGNWVFITVTVLGRLSKFNVRVVCTTVVGLNVVFWVVIWPESELLTTVIVLPVGSTTTTVFWLCITFTEFDSITNSIMQDQY
jgi:hypothetical protein